MSIEALMALLLSIWPHRAADEETSATLTDIYRVALADIPPARLEAVARLALRRCQHFPVPAELCALADEVAEAERDAAIRRRMEVEGQRIMAYPRPAGAPLLPEVALSPQQQAERERRWAENRERVKADIAAATARMRVPSGGAQRRPVPSTSEHDRAEAEAWLRAIRSGSA